MSKLTLATTKIGDLLLKDKITTTDNGKPLDNIKLSIPEYQRPYKWTARNAIQLLDDVTEAMNLNKEVYRVGTLILHKNVRQNGDVVTYDIVDGQQRSITFSLLLYALYEQEDKEKLNDIKLLGQDVFANDFSRHNIPNNLNAFRRRIMGSGNGKEDFEHAHKMNRLRSFIEKQCELIVVITEDQAEAFQFFDSQNARGKTLYPHDLLKAYHLREMSDIDADTTEKIVKEWENIPQYKLSEFFGDYLYRIKEWINGNWAYGLTDQNIYKFKGINKNARTPYAQFYKSAFSYAQLINNSAMPFVSGTREVNAFQLDTPVIAGKPFFDYTKHYYSLLKDIRDNDKYEGFYIQGEESVKTLEKHYSSGVGNLIARLLFDTALLLFVDRFCPPTFPSKVDLDYFEQFVTYAFVWAYSLRAQYYRLGWQSAQNYVLERYPFKINSLNIYKLISDSDTPADLLNTLADRISPLSEGDIADGDYKKKGDYNRFEFNEGAEADVKGDDKVFRHYLHFFKVNGFLNTNKS